MKDNPEIKSSEEMPLKNWFNIRFYIQDSPYRFHTLDHSRI